MADETTLRIITVSEGGTPAGSAPQGGPIAAQAGGSIATPPVGTIAARAASDDADRKRIGPAVQQAIASQIAPFAPRTASAIGSLSGASAGAIAVGAPLVGTLGALELFSTNLRVAAAQTRAFTQARLFEMSGDPDRAALARFQAPGGFTGSAIGERAWNIISLGMADDLKNEIAAKKEGLILQREKLGEYFSRIAPFSGPLAGQVAIGEVGRLQRDIAASQGPFFERFAKAQNAFQVERDIRSYLENTNQAISEAQTLPGRTATLTKENNERMAGMSKDVKAIVELMRKGGEDALDVLMKGLDIPDWTERGKGYDDLKKLRDQQVNAPVFSGA